MWDLNKNRKHIKTHTHDVGKIVLWKLIKGENIYVDRYM